LRSGLEPYFRRLILDGRYHAVEKIDFYGGNTGCYLTVDTGSPAAIQFRGVVPDQYGASYGELNPGQRNYTVDRAGNDRFMAENCPVVEKAALAVLADIDPAGRLARHPLKRLRPRRDGRPGTRPARAGPPTPPAPRSPGPARGSPQRRQRRPPG
jgi:hypothetical protein